MLENEPERFQDIRDAVRSLCAAFPAEYHRDIDARRAYPEKFVDALTEAGWLAALIPQEYGGSGLGLAEASVIMEEINRSGGNAGACHGQMYNMGTLLRHGSAAQKHLYLPKIASGAWRLQSMGVTEPTTGTDTTKIRTTAVKRGDRYVVNGQKVWISRVQHCDLMILLARTTPLAEVTRRRPTACRSSWSTCARPNKSGMTVRPIANMVNHETNELFFENLEIPAENLIGEEGKGFKYILDGLNAERTLIAAECIGDGYWFIDRVTQVRERARRLRPADRPEPGRAVPDRRVVHRGRGGQPDALSRLRAVRRASSRAAPRPTWPSTSPPRRPGRRPTPASSSTAASASPHEYDVERKFRETRLYQVAPISTNLILSYVAEHVLGLPRSF